MKLTKNLASQKKKKTKTKLTRRMLGEKKLKRGRGGEAPKSYHSPSPFQKEALAIPIRVNLLMAPSSEFWLKKKKRMMALENLFGGNGKRLFVGTISSMASSLGWAPHPGMCSAT